MSLNKLRSRLAFATPDLQNLTVKDLEDCLWSTKQRLVMALFQDSVQLEDEQQKIADLLEAKSAKIVQWKKAAVTKDERVAYESSFRQHFLQVMLDGLEKLRWPPAMEAFSNPLPALSDDKAVFLSAVDFILSVLHPHAQVSEGSTAKVSPRPRPRSAGLTNMMAAVGLEVGQVSQPVDISMAREDDEVTVQSHTSRSTASHTTSHSTSRPRAVESKLIYVLQLQNEQLSVQLSALQAAVSRREDAEVMIGNLMRDFRNSTADLAGIGAGSDDGAPSVGKALPTAMRRLHSSLRALEAQWEEARKAARQPAPKARSDKHNLAGNRALGYSPQAHLTGRREQAEGSEEACLATGADMHSLQRDLVRLSEAALQLCQPNDTKGLLQVCSRLEDLQSLQMAAEDLAAHCARVTPLSDDSCGSGLQKLSEGLRGLSCSKHVQASLQSALEIAMAEQQALIRAHHRSRGQSRTYSTLLRRLSGQVDALVSALPRALAERMQGLQESSKVAGELVNALHQAEGSRVSKLDRLNSSTASVGSANGSQSSRRSSRDMDAPVAPVELLAQGRAGQELAYLMLTLRSAAPALGQLQKDLDGLCSEMDASLAAALQPLQATAKEMMNCEGQARAQQQQPVYSPNGSSGTGSGRKAGRAAVQRSVSASGAKGNRPPFDLSYG